MKKFDPATRILATANIDTNKGVNPSINDSATYAFDSAEDMTACFEGKNEAFLYSRHWNPTNLQLSKALAAMEDTEAAWVTASGMGAISSTIFQLVNSGDHIISSNTVYGGTFALFKNIMPKFNIDVTFVNITDLEQVKKAIQPNTKVIYSETMTNPLLQVTNVPELSKFAKPAGIKLVIDNTFTPMIFSPARLGADIVVHSMTKFINGKNDSIAGAICGPKEFIDSLIDVNTGIAMIYGPVLDSIRAAFIHKNLYTLHLRMKQHSHNAQIVANQIHEKGYHVIYPGLVNHPQHTLMTQMMNNEFGYGGMLAIDLETKEKASRFMSLMQEKKVGYLAVSLGYFITLFSNSGKSTSSEVPEDFQKGIGLSEGLVRMSIGLDNDISQTADIILSCLD